MAEETTALTEEAAEEAQLLLNDFKNKFEAIAKEVLSQLYTDVTQFIDSDAWLNFRNDMMDGMRDYPNVKIHALYNFKAIRAQIYKEHREEIIADLNQDHLDKIADLEKQVERLQDEARRRYL